MSVFTEEQEIAPTLSATELAMQEFLVRIKEIAGVGVKLCGGKTLAEQTIIAEVSSIMSPEARLVARLQGEMYRKYPGASVRIDITESQVHTSSTDDSVRVEH